MGEVPRISVNELTACSFLDDFAAPKRPVIILDVVKDWVSLDLEQMGKDFEGCQGPVTDCSAEADKGPMTSVKIRIIKTDDLAVSSMF